MAPQFMIWMQRFGEFQTQRANGTCSNIEDEFHRLEQAARTLALVGLDYEAAARALIALERGALHIEARRFDAGLAIVQSVELSAHAYGGVAPLIEANRSLLIGNVFLIGHNAPASAKPFYQQALNVDTTLVPLICANAAVNLGICHTMLGQLPEAANAYHRAEELYLAANRPDKLPIVQLSHANILRQGDALGEAERLLNQAVAGAMRYGDLSTLWMATDDLSRLCLYIACSDEAGWASRLAQAVEASDMAVTAATMIWKRSEGDSERQLDLSDQLINLVVTRCNLAEEIGDPTLALSTLAAFKGKVRLASSLSSLSGIEPFELKKGVEDGVPGAIWIAVLNALDTLAGGGNIAFLDQFAFHGRSMFTGYAMVSKKGKEIGAYREDLPSADKPDFLSDLRSRGRGAAIVDECDELLRKIASHTNRCQWAIPEGIGTTTLDNREQLTEWASELDDSLRRLGAVFFPEELLQQLRRLEITHVILCVDPLFQRMPYIALRSVNGFILDEPWTLSLVTSATELLRIRDRSSAAIAGGAILWLAPDEDVNTRLGGFHERDFLRKIADLKEAAGADATVAALSSGLTAGHWCHFRGHGVWTGDVQTSGPVLSDGVYSTAQYVPSSGQPGFLFTAACHTAFGEAVGSESIGSLVDYDKAGLMGAVLTNWPILGEPATFTTCAFYSSLKSHGDVARAVKDAAESTRHVYPHPTIWAPFALIGTWRWPPWNSDR